MRLSSRLFLLFLLSGVVPLALLLTAGWVQFRQQLRLWTIPSFELALDASLQTNRAAIDRIRRQLEATGQEILSTPLFADQVVDDADALLHLLQVHLDRPGVDIAQYYGRREDTWVLLGTATDDTTQVPNVATQLPLPRIAEVGPQQTRPLRLQNGRGDILAIPTYHWPVQRPAESEPIVPEGCIVAGTALGPGFYENLNVASDGLGFYRRLLEVGDLLRRAYVLLIGLALLVSLAFSLWLARRVARGVSKPVEGLVTAMQALGRGDKPEVEVRSRIPEMEDLAQAFRRMRDTLKQYEERLREVEQVKGAQQTARFVAHEIRNTLTPVQAGLSILAKRVDKLPAVNRESGQRALEIIGREVDRMASLAHSFSEYAHLPDPDPEPIDLAALLLGLGLGEGETPESVRLEFDLPPTLPLILADRDEMERLFRNLVKNGIEAIEGEGTIRIAVGMDDGEGRIWVEIADTGRGMDPRTLEQAIHPGYTTKETGTGLGLALVRGSVSRYDGTFRIESELGVGTRCRVTFPIHREDRR